jgi:hypothetical protein
LDANLIMKIQDFDGTSWNDYLIAYDAPVVVPANNLVKLDHIFNPLGISIPDAGRYRVYAALTDGDNNLLSDLNGNGLEANYEFDVVSGGEGPVCGDGICTEGESCLVDCGVTEGLIAHWKMDEESWDGTPEEVIDSVGSNHGTITGAANTGSGILGRAGSFNGNNELVNAGENVNIAGRSFTLSTWAKRTSTNNYDFIFGQGIKSGSLGLHFGFRQTNKFTCSFYGNDLDTSGTYIDSDWHHWVCTYDSDTRERRIYRDGTLVASNTASVDYQGSGIFYIARTPWSLADYFGGMIDDARIYDRALSEEEVQQLYSNVG